MNKQRIAWFWKGDKRLVLNFDGAPALEIRKDRINIVDLPPFGWFLYLADGSVFERFLRVVDATLRRFEDGEPDYMDAIKGMDRKALDLCAQGFGILLQHFWCDGGYADVLGPVYMEIRTNWKGSALGQFFTPWSLCKCMAYMQTDDELLARIERGERVTVHDPACGSAATLLAMRAAVAEKFGRQAADRLALYGQDIDQTCVLMARIQCRMSNGWWMTNFQIASGFETAGMRRAA